MRIRVKLFAGLRDLLPPGTGAAGTEIEITPETTPYQVIDRFRALWELELSNQNF